MDWPFDNDTTRIIKKLAKRSLQSAKRRNIMVIVSVALAAFLISFSGGLAVSLVQMQSNQVLDTYEAVYSHITEQDIETIRGQPGISRVGKYYLIGEELSDQGFKGIFLYADPDMVYIGRKQMKLLDGKPPERIDEIMVSKNWLHKFAPDAGIGDAVSLGTDSFREDFMISGIMDTIAIEGSETYSFIISKEKLIHYEGYSRSGYRAYVHLKNSGEMSGDEIKDYCESIAAMNGFSPPAYHSQYFSLMENGTSFETVGVIGLMAAIVLVGGCVVIQSIFRISIIEKIQSFGQLRTIGATKKLITRMVRKEGRYLGWIGILIGIIPGILLPVLFVPDSMNPGGLGMVLIASALICWIMVRISIRKPVKIAANVPPVEALRFVSEQKIHSFYGKTHRKLNPISLGKINFNRDRKKAVSILVSLSIGGVLLLCVSTLLLTYSPEALARKYFPNGNYKIYIKSEKKLSEIFYSGNPLTEELRQEILAIDGVEDIITTRQSVGTDFQSDFYANGGVGDMITQDNYFTIQDALTEGNMPPDNYNILIADIYQELPVGTTVQMTLGKNTASVTVCGKINLSKAAGFGHGNLGLDGAMLYLPKGLFEELLPGVNNYQYTWDIVSDADKDASVKEGLQEVMNSHAEIALDTFSNMMAYYRTVYTVPFHIMQGVALFISLFGIINLINTTLSNHISRKQEVNILRSVGMTKIQLYKMIVFEGIWYVLLSVFLTVLVGFPMAFVMHHQISMIAFGAPTAFQFPFQHMEVYFIFLVAIELILSIWTIQRQAKQSLIEQLRSNE